MNGERTNDILVVGSHVFGLSISCADLPKTGETVLGHGFAPYLPDDGGKGSNQAMAAARLGARTSFCAVVGRDESGSKGLDSLRNASVDLSHVRYSISQSTGVSVCVLEHSGASMIVTDPGANAELDATDISHLVSAFASHKVFLTQFESPIPIVLDAARRAYAAGMRAIVTPGPFQSLADDALIGIDILAPNETEAASLLGLAECGDIGREMVREIALRRNVRNVLLTQGSRGCTILWDGTVLEVPAFHVTARNTIGAGDCFVAAFGVGLSWGLDVEQSARLGAATAAISVQNAGAPWSSYPDLQDVSAFLSANGEAALATTLQTHIEQK